MMQQEQQRRVSFKGFILQHRASSTAGKKAVLEKQEDDPTDASKKQNKESEINKGDESHQPLKEEEEKEGVNAVADDSCLN